jgi:uncharacterized phiE125 gp8 family phage protein
MSYWAPYRNHDWYGVIDSYGSLNLTEQSPAQNWVEPLTIKEAERFLRIAPTDSDVDANNELLSFIQGAREQAEIIQGRDLVQRQWDLTYDYWPSYRIQLRAPLISVDLVQRTDSNGLVTVLNEGANADYIVDRTKHPGTISPPYNGTWPTFTPYPSSALLFRFTSGYSCEDPFWRDAGARVKTGMKLLISHWYNNRLPFETGVTAVAAYDYSVTSCLSYGSLVRAR